MPISGLVITLSSEPKAQREALLDLAGDDSLILGLANGRRLPAAMNSTDPKTAKAAYFQLLEHPGIEHIDVVYVNFDDEEDALNPTTQPAGSTL